MNKTGIEWALNPDGTPGYTWNPITGCLNHVNGICKGGGFPCYAYRLAHGRLKNRYCNGGIFPPFGSGAKFYPIDDPFYPRFWPERMKELNQGYKRNKGIFVCDMSDLFGIGVPEDWTKQILDSIKRTWMNPFCRFYLLTKQPQNLIKWSPFPDNCWVGVTATNYTMFAFALEYLKGIKARLKYVSIEPMLDSLNIPLLNEVLVNCGINWLIIGAQTRPYKPPKIEWVNELVEAADKAGIPVFLKDNLRPLIADAREAKGMWRAEHLIRQEMPHAI